MTIEPEIGSHDFRRVLGRVPTSAVVITTTDSTQGPVGMVVGSFTSVSMDPPLVAFLADLTSTTLPKIVAAGRFCANALAADQESLSRNMARRGVDRFAHVAWRLSELGNPILDGVSAWVDCQSSTTVELGDHLLVVGQVHDLQSSDKAPLIFLGGRYGEYMSAAELVLQRLVGW